MEVWKGNFVAALTIAIQAQREYEQSKGYTWDSALVAGWQSLLDAINSGQVSAVYLKPDSR